MRIENEAKFRIALGILGVLVIIGTIFYHFVEGWSYLDAIYFSSTTLTTIGFGDFHPTTPISKIFTIFYVLSGVSLTLYAIAEFAKIQLEIGEGEVMNRLMKRSDKGSEVVWAHLKRK
jgi:voltage-gated potassium channel